MYFQQKRKRRINKTATCNSKSATSSVLAHRIKHIANTNQNTKAQSDINAKGLNSAPSKSLVSLMVVHYLYKCCGRRYLPVEVLLSLLLLDFQCKSRAKDALQPKYRAIIT